jgi:hypothetical protein
VAYTCHDKLLGRLRMGGWWFQASLGNEVLILSGKKKKTAYSDVCQSSQQLQET